MSDIFQLALFMFQRNKRMFGNLLGTLQKFRQDETKIKDREQKKRKIEEKIEEKSVKEREDAKLKKKELFTEREKKKHELKVLEVKVFEFKGKYTVSENRTSLDFRQSITVGFTNSLDFRWKFFQNVT